MKGWCSAMKNKGVERFRIVAKQEFRETVRSTPFITISIFLAALLICCGAGLLLFSLLSDSDGGISELFVTDDPEDKYDTIVAIEDRTGGGIADMLERELPLMRFDRMTLDDDAVERAIRSGDCDAYVIIKDSMSFDCREKLSIYKDSCSDQIAAMLERSNRISQLEKNGVSPSDAGLILDARAVYTLSQVGGYDVGKYLFNTVMVIMMFFVIALYGQMVSNRVATEKGSRTMEILATSVRPFELLCGKVVGVGAAGLMQVLLFSLLLFGMLRTVVMRISSLSLVLASLADITVPDIVWLLLYFVLGFLMVAFIYGGLGSMVSQVEDLSGISSLPMYLLMIGYLIAMSSTVTGESNILLKIASFVPFWSPIVMFSRMSVEQVPSWQIIISLAILAGSSVVTAALSARMYRSGMLRYGKPPKLRELVDAVKHK